MHHAVALRAVLFRAKLLHRQRVHICAKQRRWSGFLTAQRREDTRLADAAANLVESALA
jgi:hypothetical protein